MLTSKNYSCGIRAYELEVEIQRSRQSCQWGWKFGHSFHFGGKFSTSKNFQIKKLFQNHMNWNILQRWKFFHFWWKIFHFDEILFSGSGPSSLPNLSPKTQSGNFSTLVENFPLSKSCKKKIFLFQNHMNWVILHRKVFSEKSEIFPLFPKTRKFIYSGL